MAHKYRVAIMHDGRKFYTTTLDNWELSSFVDNDPEFVDWLTDWNEYKVYIQDGKVEIEE